MFEDDEDATIILTPEERKKFLEDEDITITDSEADLDD